MSIPSSLVPLTSFFGGDGAYNVLYVKNMICCNKVKIIQEKIKEKREKKKKVE